MADKAAKGLYHTICVSVVSFSPLVMLGNTAAAAAATSWEMELLTPDTALALFYAAKNHASSLQSDVWAPWPFSILHWDLFSEM